jgi:hypothetical protein
MAIKITTKDGSSEPVVKSPYADDLFDSPPPKSNKALIDHLAPNKMKQPPIHTTTQVSGGSEKIGLTPGVTEEHMYSPAIAADKLHTLSVGGKRKIMLENYGGPKFESAEIFVSITMPCTKETLGDAYDFGSQWVSNRIQATLDAAKKGKS